ncbi:MAG TPA: hypothetical protein VGL76_06560 [Gaiellaceae bacterium]
MNALVAAVFAAAAGWHVGAGPVHACPGVPASRCVQVASWAATVRWRDCGECLPQKTIDALQPDGVAIEVVLSVEHPPVAHRTIAWPPHITSATLSGIEGIPNKIGVYQVFARVGGGKEAYVWAFFGRGKPTHAQIAKANAELATVRLR